MTQSCVTLKKRRKDDEVIENQTKCGGTTQLTKIKACYKVL